MWKTNFPPHFLCIFQISFQKLCVLYMWVVKSHQHWGRKLNSGLQKTFPLFFLLSLSPFPAFSTSKRLIKPSDLITRDFSLFYLACRPHFLNPMFIRKKHTRYFCEIFETFTNKSNLHGVQIDGESHHSRFKNRAGITT